MLDRFKSFLYYAEKYSVYRKLEQYRKPSKMKSIFKSLVIK